MESDLLLSAYIVPLLAIWLGYAGYRKHREKAVRQRHAEAVEAGLTQPASLHPLVDAAHCIGCGACVTACPEGDVLGLVNGKVALIEPTQCIGHGACAAACPLDAISLVFGTEERGVDIPYVGPDFQTNVPGMFIAGELGGMGLIRNAIEQGRQAMDEISRFGRSGERERLDVVIIGAGPAGFSASLAAKEKGLRYVTLEQDSLGGTVSHFPRGKLVMTAPATLPIIGKVNFRETSKEALLQFWTGVATEANLQIHFEERVEAIEPDRQGFSVVTAQNRYTTRAVLLAIGRRGTPRKLNVPGEELPKVVYRLIDPEQYRGQHVLVVGGGDSALEAAASIAEEPGTQVTLSYRSDAFSRAKAKNRRRIEAAQQAGQLDVILRSNIVSIAERHVDLECDGIIERVRNDAVIVCAGGILPTGFLKSVGITVETKYGTV